MPDATPRAPILSGDPRAFDRLYAEFAPRVLGYLLPLTGGRRAEAEDLVQETFLAAYAHRDTFRGRSQPLAWLLGIARRRWRDGRRGTAREIHSIDTPNGVEPAVEGHAEQVTRATTLEWALTRLKEEEREIVLLVTVQGLSYREAAEILEQPVGTLKWRAHEALRHLRTLLKEWKEDKKDDGPEDARSAAKPDRTVCGR